VKELYVIIGKILDEGGKGKTNNTLMGYNGWRGTVWLEVNEIE
jgi:hypothetical protein